MYTAAAVFKRCMEDKINKRRYMLFIGQWRYVRMAWKVQAPIRHVDVWGMCGGHITQSINKRSLLKEKNGKYSISQTSPRRWWIHSFMQRTGALLWLPSSVSSIFKKNPTLFKNLTGMKEPRPPGCQHTVLCVVLTTKPRAATAHECDLTWLISPGPR